MRCISDRPSELGGGLLCGGLICAQDGHEKHDANGDRCTNPGEADGFHWVLTLKMWAQLLHVIFRKYKSETKQLARMTLRHLPGSGIALRQIGSAQHPSRPGPQSTIAVSLGARSRPQPTL